jgi:LysR family transcriptional regulator for bpeEF and oprC
VHAPALRLFGGAKGPLPVENQYFVRQFVKSLKTGNPDGVSLISDGSTRRRPVQGRTMVTVNESTAHVTGLLAGLGVGQTFRYIAQPYFNTGALIPLLMNWGRPRHPIHVMYPPNRHLNAKVRVFVDWAVEVFAKFDDRVADSGS